MTSPLGATPSFPSVAAVVVGGDASGLGLVRSLGPSGMPVIVLDTEWLRPAMHSRYARPVVIEALSGPLLVEGLLSVAARLQGRAVLFLTSDLQVETVSEARDRLAPWYHLRLPPHEDVCRLLHKSGFQAIAEQHGFAVPRTVSLRSEADLPLLATLRFPAIVKPAMKALFLSNKAPRGCRAGSQEAAEALCREILPQAPDLVAQEWIEGTDSDIYFCLQYRGAGGALVRSFTGRKLQCWPPLTGSTASCTAAAPEVEAILEPLTSAFFVAAGFVGMGSMEFKRDRRSGTFLMIEPTVGRADWQEEVASLHGINIPLAAYCCELGLPLPPVVALPPVVWRDPPSCWRSMIATRSLFPPRLGPGKIVRSCWRWSDPAPLAFFWLDWLRKGVAAGLSWTAIQPGYGGTAGRTLEPPLQGHRETR